MKRYDFETERLLQINEISLSEYLKGVHLMIF